MRASSGIYPALGRYFKTITELAEAGCMCRQRMTDCLRGRCDFTEAEKEAIKNSVIVKSLKGQFGDVNELIESDFDEYFKKE